MLACQLSVVARRRATLRQGALCLASDRVWRPWSGTVAIYAKLNWRIRPQLEVRVAMVAWPGQARLVAVVVVRWAEMYWPEETSTRMKHEDGWLLMTCLAAIMVAPLCGPFCYSIQLECIVPI